MKQLKSYVSRLAARSLAAAVVLLLLPGVASAITYTLDVSLDGLQETPPNASPAFGLATLSLDDVTGAVVVLSGSYQDLVSPSTAIHIHGLALPGTPAGVLIPLTLDSPGATTGTFSGSGFLSPANVSGMLAGLAYVNIHSEAFSGGEIRGQATIIPEPSTIVLGGLCALALLAVGWRRRR